MRTFAAVRCVKIRDLSHLNRIALHGQRQDPTAKKRVNSARTGLNLAGSAYAEDPLDLVAAYKERKRRSGASEYGQAAIGLHVILVVSPDVVTAGGDPHSPQNPVNRKLFDAGQAWAEAEFGAGSVVGARLDLDESGSGVLDLLLVPVRRVKVNKSKEKTIISVRQALQDIQTRHNKTRSYEALQDSWAMFARERIDRRLKRGRPKRETKRSHIHADVFREEASAMSNAISSGFAAITEGDLVAVNPSANPTRLASWCQPDPPLAWRMGQDVIDEDLRRLREDQIIHCWDSVSAPLAALIEAKEKLAADAARAHEMASEKGLAKGRLLAAEEARQVTEAFEVGVKSIIDGDLIGVDPRYKPIHQFAGMAPRYWRDGMDEPERDRRDSIIALAWEQVKLALAHLLAGKRKIDSITSSEYSAAHEKGLVAGRDAAEAAFQTGVDAFLSGRLEPLPPDQSGRPSFDFRAGDDPGQTIDMLRKAIAPVYDALHRVLWRARKMLAGFAPETREALMHAAARRDADEPRDKNNSPSL